MLIWGQALAWNEHASRMGLSVWTSYDEETITQVVLVSFKYI